MTINRKIVISLGIAIFSASIIFGGGSGYERESWGYQQSEDIGVVGVNDYFVVGYDGYGEFCKVPISDIYIEYWYEGMAPIGVNQYFVVGYDGYGGFCKVPISDVPIGWY